VQATTASYQKFRRHTIVFVLAFCSGIASADDLPPQSVLRIGAAEHGTATFANAQALARVYQQDSIKQRAIPSHEHSFGVAVSSAGSIANLRDLSAGRLEFGYVLANLADIAIDQPASLGLDQSTSRLRLIAGIEPSQVLILTHAEAAYDSLSDLSGSRISFGLPDGGYLRTVEPLFTQHDVDMSTLDKFHYPLNLALQKLQSRKLDAVVMIDQTPNPVLRSLLQQNQLTLLSLDAGIVEKLSTAESSSHFTAITEHPFDRAADYQGVAVDTWLLSQDTVAPTSVFPLLKHLLAQNEIFRQRQPGKDEEQPYRLQDLDSAVPKHAACSILLPENRLTKGTGFNNATVSASGNASADY